METDTENNPVVLPPDEAAHYVKFFGLAARPVVFHYEISGSLVRVYTRPLENGQTALGFFNLGDDDWHVTYPLRAGSHVRDVIAHADLGETDRLSWTIPPHATRVVTCRGM